MGGALFLMIKCNRNYWSQLHATLKATKRIERGTSSKGQYQRQSKIKNKPLTKLLCVVVLYSNLPQRLPPQISLDSCLTRILLIEAAFVMLQVVAIRKWHISIQRWNPHHVNVKIPLPSHLRELMWIWKYCKYFNSILAKSFNFCLISFGKDYERQVL